MDKMRNKIKTIMERFINEIDDVPDDENDEKKQIKIFYEDLDMTGKQKVLEAIDASYEYVDVFTDDIVRDNIEEALSKIPMITLSGEELVNKTGIEL
jgi:hypothetical protein